MSLIYWASRFYVNKCDVPHAESDMGWATWGFMVMAKHIKHFHMHTTTAIYIQTINFQQPINNQKVLKSA